MQNLLYCAISAALTLSGCIICGKSEKTNIKSVLASAVGTVISALVPLLLYCLGDNIWVIGAVVILAVLFGGAAFTLISYTLKVSRNIAFNFGIFGGLASVALPTLGKSEKGLYAALTIYGVLLFLCVIFCGRMKNPLSYYISGFKITNYGRYKLLCAVPLSCFTISVPCAIAAGNDSIRACLMCGCSVLGFVAAIGIQYAVGRGAHQAELIDNMTEWNKGVGDYMNVIRSQRHDFNLHLHAISGLIAREDYAACKTYVDNLVHSANEVNDIMPISDAMIGSMLYNMRNEARKIGSDIVYDITYDMSDVACNGFQCNKIIGNLLQNAIDAIQSDEDKAFGIKMCVFKRRGNSVITVENRFVGDKQKITRAFEAGYSTKKNHEGIGLPMCKKTVESYGGRIYPEFTEDTIKFIVNIPNHTRFTGGEMK